MLANICSIDDAERIARLRQVLRESSARVTGGCAALGLYDVELLIDGESARLFANGVIQIEGSAALVRRIVAAVESA